MVTKTTNLQVRTGNRVVVQFGGTQVGLLQNLRPSDEYGFDAASGIGDIHVQEHVPTVARHSISAGALVLFTKNMRQQGIALENGDDALKGLVFDIIVQSKDDGTVLRKWTGVSFVSGSIDIQKHQMIVQDAQFMALDVKGTGI